LIWKIRIDPFCVPESWTHAPRLVTVNGAEADVAEVAAVVVVVVVVEATGAVVEATVVVVVVGGGVEVARVVCVVAAVLAVVEIEVEVLPGGADWVASAEAAVNPAAPNKKTLAKASHRCCLCFNSYEDAAAIAVRHPPR
jgi:hypothetical protein